MPWLDFANHFLSNQIWHVLSWINRTFSGMVFWWEIWIWMFWPFPFLFCLVRGEKVVSAQDFGWQSMGKDHFKSWFPLFSLFGCDYFGYLFGLKTILYNSLIFFRSWSGVFFSRSFFVFFQSLIGNLFSFWFSFDLWSGTSSFLFLLFSSEGEDGNSHPGSRFMVSWDFGSELVERLDMIDVRVLVWSAVQR